MAWTRGRQAGGLWRQGEPGAAPGGGQMAAVSVALTAVVATRLVLRRCRRIAACVYVSAGCVVAVGAGIVVSRGIDRRTALQTRFDGSHQALRQYHDQHQQYGASRLWADELHRSCW